MSYRDRGGIELSGMAPNTRPKRVAGPKPEATKPWHKIIVDIVTVLLFLGAIAWFVFGVLM